MSQRVNLQKFDQQKIYSRAPEKVAKHWSRCGAKFLHVVDLDGAACGKPKNLGALKKIVQAVDIPVEFGGGVREIETVECLLRLGVKRIVLGTKALADRKFLEKIFRKFGEKVIVSLDARDGWLRVDGWKNKSSGKKALDFAQELKEIGFKQVIYTDIAKDGMLSGPNLKETRELLKSSGLQVIASGGVSSLQDLAKLKTLQKLGLVGVIIGKALYEGKFTLGEALKIA